MIGSLEEGSMKAKDLEVGGTGLFLNADFCRRLFYAKEKKGF